MINTIKRDSFLHEGIKNFCFLTNTQAMIHFKIQLNEINNKLEMLNTIKNDSFLQE